MRSGRMDRILTLKKRTVTGQDTYGEETESFAEIEVWGERRELRGSEGFAAQQTIARLAARYFIHYREDIDAMDELVDPKAKTYDIHSVLEVGRREGLEIFVTHREGQ